MRTLALALAYCLGVAAGACVPATGAPAAALLGLVVGVSACLHLLTTTRWAGAALVLGGLWFGFARGASAVLPAPASEARGLPALLSVRVEGPSQPGPQCQVPLSGGALLATTDEACAYGPGDRLVLSSEARRGDLGAELPGERGESERIRARADVAVPLEEGGHRYWTWVVEQRRRAWSLSRGDAALSLVVASALGMRSALSPRDRNALRAAGLGHLIAVSGVHVGVAALLLYGLSLRAASSLGRSPKLAVLVSWVPMIAYVGLTGAAPSAVRAAAMLTLVGLGAATGRPAHGLCSLAVVAAAMLAFDPGWVAHAGFQLSIAAMAALVTAPPGTGLVAQSWRVSWAVAPISWWHFGQASAYGLVTNLVAIPIFSLWVLPTGLIGWFLVPWLDELALWPARAGAELVIDLARVVARWPAPSARVLLVAAILALAVWAGRRFGPGRLRQRVPPELVPPPLAALGLALAVAWPGPSLASRHWYALGGRRSHTLVLPDANRPGLACIREPRGAALGWPRRLDALGVRAVVEVESRRPGPDVEELRRVLRGAGRFAPGPNDCIAIDERRAAALLRACLRRRGARRAIVRGIAGRAGARCFVAGDWRLLASEPE